MDIMGSWILVNIFDASIDIADIIKEIIRRENWDDSVQMEVLV
jgi:hypothetical protein